jgi:hypothetical protein
MQTQIAGTRKKKTNRIHNVTLLRIRYFRKERWQLKTHVDASTQQVGARMRLADSRRRFIGASSISAQSWYREKSVDKEDDEPADPHQEKNEAVADESSSLSEFCI